MYAYKVGSGHLLLATVEHINGNTHYFSYTTSTDLLHTTLQISVCSIKVIVHYHYLQDKLSDSLNY